MTDIYTAAIETIEQLRLDMESGDSFDTDALRKLVTGSYMLFCSLAGSAAVDDVKCRLTQLVSDCAERNLITKGAFNNYVKGINNSYLQSGADMELPLNLAVKIHSLLDTGSIKTPENYGTESLISMASLFNLPILLSDYAKTPAFKEYLYATIRTAYDNAESEDGLVSKELQLAIHLGVLAGVYTFECSQQLYKTVPSRDEFEAACEKAIYPEVSTTNVF